MGRILKSVRKNRDGFTLVELMAVVVILGILVAFAVPKVINSITSAKEKTDKANILSIQRAVYRVYAETGNYPASLDALVTQGYMENIPLDPIIEEEYEYNSQSGVVSHPH